MTVNLPNRSGFASEKTACNSARSGEMGVRPPDRRGMLTPLMAASRFPWTEPICAAVLAGLAGGMGWGIRGQYGHETGAMIAGLFVASVLVLRFVPHWRWANAARAIALATVAMGVGGSETYAQSIGLTQDANLIGHEAAWRWGMLGLAIKGGVWIGFCGLFLGMGLGGIRYRPLEALVGVAVLLALYGIGVRCVNQPFDPSHRILPPLYFSADWRWLPDATLKPRREIWAGLWASLIGAWLWVGWRRGDALACRLAMWGVVGGAIGFPLGQTLQSYHAWHPDQFHDGIWKTLDPQLNWWNWMESTFGTVMGATLGLGVWMHRSLIRELPLPDSGNDSVSRWEVLPRILLTVHVVLLTLSEFGSNPTWSGNYDHGLNLLWLPLILVLWSSRCAVAMILPATLIPIAGKTFVQLAHQEHYVTVAFGVVAYLSLPLLSIAWLAQRLSSPHRLAGPAAAPAAWALMGMGGWIWWLNFEFFHRPWPWTAWTYRTPNLLYFTLALVAMIALAVMRIRTTSRSTHVR